MRDALHESGERVLALAHLSDPHLSPRCMPRLRELASKRALGYLAWRLRRRRGHDDAVLEAARRSLAERGDELVTITGDLTQLAMPAEYRAAARWLAGLAPAERVIVVPGNHDLYVPVNEGETLDHWQPYLDGGAAAPAEGRFPFQRRWPGAAVIGVNTAYPSAPLLAVGRIGQPQLQALAGLLEAAGARGEFRVILMHHPPQPGAVQWRKSLLDAERFRAVVRRHGAELILHGHAHRLMHAELEGPAGPVPVLGAPSVSACSGEPGRRAAYHRCLVSPNGAGWQVDVAVHAYSPGSGGFTPRLELARRLWLPRRGGLTAPAGAVTAE